MSDGDQYWACDDRVKSDRGEWLARLLKDSDRVDKERAQVVKMGDPKMWGILIGLPWQFVAVEIETMNVKR